MLVLEILLQYYEQNNSVETKRSILLDKIESVYYEQYNNKSGLGHSTFARILKELEEEMAISIKKIGKKHTTIIVHPEKIRKMVNDMKSKLGYYRQEVKMTIDDIDPNTLEPFYKQVADAMLDNYNSPWLGRIDEQSQDAHLITQRCASKVLAKLISSRFGFTLRTFDDSSFKSIDKNRLSELAIVSSKIASNHQEQPFRLLVEYSGLPDSGDWGIITKGDLWDTVVTHFEVFAERVFKFNLSKNDMHYLEDKRPSSMSNAAVRLFDIFRDGYLLPTLRAMKSKQIKLDRVS